MDFTAVNSSNIKAYAYDKRERSLLLIFRKRPNLVYVYPNVAQALYLEFINAESFGKFFHDYLAERDFFTITT